MVPKNKATKAKGKLICSPAETKIQDDDNSDDVLDDEDSDMNERVVQFFEDRPYFYDIAHNKWSNKKLKDADLKAFADNTGWARKYFVHHLTRLFIEYSPCLRQVSIITKYCMSGY